MTYRLKSLIRNLWFGPGFELLCKWLFRLEIDYILLPLEWKRARSNPNNLSSDRDRLDYDLWFDHAVRAIAITQRDVYIKHFNRITAISEFNLLYMKPMLNHAPDLESLVILEIKYELTGRDRSRDDLVFFFLSTTSPRSIISEWIIFLIDWRFSLSSGFFPIWIEILRKVLNNKKIHVGDGCWRPNVLVTIIKSPTKWGHQHHWHQ